ncbi:MAG TPA: RecX family transcriptional regulator [Anaerolineales bacterium]|nr:RecX family transcriptional regulator [Anaerolineales bacterium]
MKKITALVAQKRNPGRVNIYLDDEYAFGLSRISAAWLVVGQEIDEAKVEALLEADRNEIAYQRAVQFLSYRPRSEAEVEANLAKHDVDPGTIQATLDRLRKAELVDDRRFARDWVSNRAEFNPRGIRGLRYELRSKKINDDLIEEVLQDVDEENLAYQFATRKASAFRNIDRGRFFAKLNGLLARRGFSSSVIVSVSRRVWEETFESTLES